MPELPCDADGCCMVCKAIPSDSEVVLCNSCSSPWHMACLHIPMTSVPAGDWFCPDCEPSSSSSLEAAKAATYFSGDDGDFLARIRTIRADPKLSEQEKARRCQDVMFKNGNVLDTNGTEEKKIHKMLQIFDENLNCIFCMQLADRPVTTPCGHNFCLKCFQRWVAQGKKECGKCRTLIPAKMAYQPRINSALVVAIRMAKSSSLPAVTGLPKPYHYIQNQNRPDKCFTTERAKKPGKSNAASGKIFVTVPPDHFGPITAENDPLRGQGVLVGETWEDRLECRQWGVHLPHVAGIAGQSDYGAQSVALSGGYEDDEDHGEWFLYTGSGGRDLSGNKRTNDKQSFDQKFDKSNLALKVSCKRGYPVRVVRSHKEKRSSYAPESGVRYDGIYRIEKCWRKNGVQGFKVCRYLFVRCDNEPAPWTSDHIGDRPRSLPEINELDDAVDLTERRAQPAWDWKEEEGKWGWVSIPPTSRKSDDGSCASRGGSRKLLTIGQRLLKEFGCGLCKKVLKLPLSTPCGHNFCKSCLLDTFSGQKDMRERTCEGGRLLRAKKVVKRCPVCQGDIGDFLINPQVNRQMKDVIQSLKEENSDTENNGTSNGEEILSSHEEEVDLMELCENTSGNSNEPASSAEPGNVCDGPDDYVRGTQVRMGAVKEEFLMVCAKFPMYSEELLHSMLIDQEGDVGELECLLIALQKQEKKIRKQQKNAKQEESGDCDVLKEETEQKNGVKNPQGRLELKEDVNDLYRQKKLKKEGAENQGEPP